MANITKFESPITGGGNLLSPANWIQGIMWVFFVGVVFKLGASLLQKVDNAVPVSLTPNNYKENIIGTASVVTNGATQPIVTIK